MYLMIDYWLNPGPFLRVLVPSSPQSVVQRTGVDLGVGGRVFTINLLVLTLEDDYDTFLCESFIILSSFLCCCHSLGTDG